MKTANIEINSIAFSADRELALDLMIAISTAHGRVLSKMNECGDMEEATRMAYNLIDLNTAHGRLKALCDDMEAE